MFKSAMEIDEADIGARVRLEANRTSRGNYSPKMMLPSGVILTVPKLYNLNSNFKRDMMHHVLTYPEANF